MSEIMAYSGHAVRRMMERGISCEAVEAAVRWGTVDFETRDRVRFVRGRVRAVVSTSGLLITVWRVPRRCPKRRLREARRARARR